MSPSRGFTVREPVVAGTWYPGSPRALLTAVEGYLDAVRPHQLPGPVLALVSPHAGLTFSGPIAAHAYAQVRGATFTRVVLLGPLHRPIRGQAVGFFAVPAADVYRTPLGDVPLDRAFITSLGRHVGLTTVGSDQEHCLEVQLPFLQVALGACQLVPIMLAGHIADPGAMAAADTLAATLVDLADEGTLFVASTDLTHGHDYDEVVSSDRRLVNLLRAFDVDGLSEALRRGQAQACGATGLLTVLRASIRRAAKGSDVLAYGTSGDVTGDKQPGTYTVGYLAAAVHG